MGNSVFYDVLLPEKEIFQAIFCSEGFSGAILRESRKQNSKKELYEFIVRAKT